MRDALQSSSLAGESWREYRFLAIDAQLVTHHIDGPKTLYTRPGGTTHRVLDGDGLVHIVPAPGFAGCVVVVCPLDSDDPVQF